MMEELDEVFKLAKTKAAIRSSVEGNTATPWKDFPPRHLDNRLIDEFVEWLKVRDVDDELTVGELIDIINLAAFRCVQLLKSDGGS